MYTANPSQDGYFTLPAAAADRYLKLAGAAQLKVLLAVFRNMASPLSLADVAAMTGLREGDAADALLFWTERGVIASTQTEPTVPQPAQRAPEAVPAKKTEEKPTSAPEEKKRIPKIKPTTAQINKRSREDPEIRSLFLEAQSILGRTIGYDTQAQLLMCCDYLGLPVPVVLMICEYARISGKTGISYITGVAEDWAHSGVVTLEEANRRISVLEETSGVWKRFAAQVGITNPSPTRTQSEYLYKWTVTFGYTEDTLLLAYEEMANHITRFSMAYIDKMMEAWHAAGLKNTAEIRASLEEKRKEQTQSPRKQPAAQQAKTRETAAGRAEVSYDIGAAEAAAAQGAPVYERKKRK